MSDTEHLWTQENLAGYHAGGLTDDETQRLERHLADCPPCQESLTQTRRLDQALTKLFGPAQPSLGLEDRMIVHLRTPSKGMPTWAWLASGIAAAVLLASIGAGFQRVMQGNEVLFPGARLAESRPQRFRPLIHGHVHHGPNVVIDNSESMPPPALALIVDEDAKRENTTISGGVIGGKHARAVIGGKKLEPGSAGIISALPEGKRAIGVRVNMESLAGGFAALPNSRVDIIQTVPRGDKTFSQVLLENVLVLAADSSSRDEYFRAMPANVVTFAIDTEELLKLNVAKEIGSLSIALRRFGDEKSAEQAKVTVEDVLTRRNRKEEEVEEFQGPGAASGLPKVGSKKLDVAQIQPPANQPTMPPPEPAASRKVIRTGEVEFEVDSFDAAFAQIGQLVSGIKGAFIVTRNSDKLENGKTRGSIVVRLPPDALDRFLLDLRRDLGKTGEMKNQRIGSQDVSRQYTDIESRLRAARTMEERLLNIIKTGKGEIKDLVAAEQQLGIWHTKIEEMEGEIRYLNNQVALSTLTINLQEKELLTPATLVVSELVRLRVEVEDVDKSQNAILAAATELKGRVTRAELKQHAYGQLEAHVHIDVPPEHATEMRRRLSDLGQVTKQDAERSQKADGGSGKALESTPRLSDVRFEVIIYNVADIEPAEILHLDLASKDVPAGFRKLLDAASQAKGQVRKGELKEEDRLNVTAQFDVDVPAAQRTAIDRTLAEIGDVIARTSQSNQGKPSDTVTRSKVGYRIVLSSVARIPPRETVTFDIEVKHVEQDFAAVVEMVRANQGIASTAQVTQDKAGQTTGQLKFDVPLTVKDELVRKLRELGTVRVQQATRNARVPESPLATAQFVVTLTSTGPIVPRDEGLGQQVRTSLFYSFKVLSASLMFLILGLSLVLPWGLVVYVGYRIVRWTRRKAVANRSSQI